MRDAGRPPLPSSPDKMRAPFPLRFILASLLATVAVQGSPADIERALSLGQRTENKIFRENFDVQWLPDGTRCWYRVQTAAKQWEFVLVDAETGAVRRAATAAELALPVRTFISSAESLPAAHASRRTGPETHLHLANRMSEAVVLTWIDPENKRHAYGQVRAGAEWEQKTYAGHVWLIADPSGNPLAVFEASPEPLEVVIDGPGKPIQEKEKPAPNTSPDGKWIVDFARNNLTVRPASGGEPLFQTHDGTAAQPWRGPASWAPDSQSFVALSVTQVRTREVTEVESSPTDQTQPKVRTFPYAKPGDALPHPHPALFRLADQAPLRIAEDLFPNPFTPDGRLAIRWSPRGDEFTFDYNQRGHQLYRIIGVNAATGATRAIVEERSATFIDYTQKTGRHWLDGSGELLWMSERDGWCHLWLYDVASGAPVRQITRGRWVLRQVEKVDEDARQIWFLASGLRAEEDPYHLHLCRVNFDGGGFVQLTPGDGNHAVTFSPDGRFFVDRWSRADLPPVTELRRSEDGGLVCELERADATALLATGWTMPERFVAKGRDGTTDIYGVLIRPPHFDPAQKYPILEEVYAGPHGAFAPKTFDRLVRMHSFAELGFVVVQADGMGTNFRGKAFHDVCWKNLADAGFPDRIAWIKAAAATRPWMDLSRVGIWGGSAGGQTAMRALLDHHDFYRSAFADCGCHDNRMDKIWWNEQWLGWPVDESYARCSNVVNAGRLEGALMLCVGELDHNVDPASTMQVAAALEKAGKTFDLLVIAGAGHGAAELPYGSRRRLEFFARHLLEPDAR